ncbi:hypothetical protein BDY21DRAFT_362979 [Lineolata rhizophorae]|uniref:Uncharacterized protein n=1 Tax=Lineolata rhizophorae TaxID=578093 RepID=A0A6A6P4Q8_9PEZI|nr:hypothetical protein BDY21DRAFT_362979 [Lineolata rhizophorae]
MARELVAPHYHPSTFQSCSIQWKDSTSSSKTTGIHEIAIVILVTAFSRQIPLVLESGYPAIEYFEGIMSQGGEAGSRGIDGIANVARALVGALGVARVGRYWLDWG